jgi:outer membrane protein OmpA-like peptidoglycan-associated protein
LYLCEYINLIRAFSAQKSPDFTLLLTNKFSNIMLRNYILVCLSVCFAYCPSLNAQNFQLQIASYPDSVALSDFKDKGFTSVYHLLDQNGLHRYFAGTYTTREEAETVQAQVIAKGFHAATIIDLEEQRALCGTPCPYFKGGSTFTQDPTQSSTVRNLYFDYSKSALSKEAKAELDGVYQIMKKSPQSSLKILGYTDGMGSPIFNIQLATRRARAARNYLIEKGLHADKMYIKVFGELDPQKPNSDDMGKDSPESRKWNRRVVLAVIDPSGEVQTTTAK